jgi:hypothetical protein
MVLRPLHSREDGSYIENTQHAIAGGWRLTL